MIGIGWAIAATLGAMLGGFWLGHNATRLVDEPPKLEEPVPSVRVSCSLCRVDGDVTGWDPDRPWLCRGCEERN